MAKRSVLMANGLFIRIGGHIAIGVEIQGQQWDDPVPGASLPRTPIDPASMNNVLLGFDEIDYINEPASMNNVLLGFDEIETT
mgnify:FL=1